MDEGMEGGGHLAGLIEMLRARGGGGPPMRGSDYQPPFGQEGGYFPPMRQYSSGAYGQPRQPGEGVIPGGLGQQQPPAPPAPPPEPPPPAPAPPAAPQMTPEQLAMMQQQAAALRGGRGGGGSGGRNIRY